MSINVYEYDSEENKLSTAIPVGMQAQFNETMVNQGKIIRHENSYFFKLQNNLVNSKNPLLLYNKDITIPLIEQGAEVMTRLESTNFVYPKIVLTSPKFKDIIGSCPEHIVKMISHFTPHQLERSITKLLKKDFNMDFNESQKTIMWNLETCLAIGRSGTGKTQSCLLQLLSSEMLAYGYKVRLGDKKAKLSGKEISKCKKYFFFIFRVRIEDCLHYRFQLFGRRGED